MKRLLIIPIILVLIIFSLYSENVEGMDSNRKANLIQETQIEEEILKVYNNSKNEINTTIEVNETREKEFSVEIKGDLNTTKQTVIKLTAVVKNAYNLKACNYFWYENKEILDMGQTLQKAFEKGEHNITLVVKDANGNETNNSVTVRAYNYYSVTELNYDAYYGNLLYTAKVITNHRGQYVLNDNGRYDKSLLTYNKDEKLVSKTVEYYQHPEENRRTEFIYNDVGKCLSSQSFNAEGESVDYMLNVYDENSTLINTRYGTSPDDINENAGLNGKVYYESASYTSIPNTEVNIKEDIVELNDNGQIVYEEHYYGDDKFVNKMMYDEENKLIKVERNTDSFYDSSRTIIEYDKQNNPINKENKYEIKGHSFCHYSSVNTFTNLGQIKSNVSTLLGGECTYIDELKRVYSYDENGRIINIKVSTDNGEIIEGYSTLVVIKEYINEIDI